jgi:hypothetical protein
VKSETEVPSGPVSVAVRSPTQVWVRPVSVTRMFVKPFGSCPLVTVKVFARPVAFASGMLPPVRA